MWSGWSVNPIGASFEAARGTAANVPQTEEQGRYTREMFLEDFPQFNQAMAEGQMLGQFIAQANDSVLPDRWGSMWRYAAGLYVAHFSAMYLKTYSLSPQSARQAAGNAEQKGVVKTVAMGDTSVSYDNSAVTAGTEKWGTWNATQYGQQLVTLARMVGMGGMYAI